MKTDLKELSGCESGKSCAQNHTALKLYWICKTLSSAQKRETGKTTSRGGSPLRVSFVKALGKVTGTVLTYTVE